MADISAREWGTQYDALKKRIQNQRINGVQFSSEDVRMIEKSVGTLEAQLKTMSANVLQYELSASEVARREVQITNMKKTTSVLFGKTSAGGGIAPLNISSAGSSGQAQSQAQIMKQQDEMILEIGSGVDRLHHKAILIGDEAKTHTRLLDALDTNVESATDALQAETAHAAEIREKGKVCYMYICIVVEIIVLLLLVILAFSM
jgi:t-SNARE complex subunit (syntaxin)